MPNLKTIPEGNFLVAQTSKKRYLRWFSRHSHPPDMLSQILDIIPAYPKVFWGLFCVFQKCKINLKRIIFFPITDRSSIKNVIRMFTILTWPAFSFDFLSTFFEGRERKDSRIIIFLLNYWPRFHTKGDKNVCHSSLTCLQFWISVRPIFL